MAQFTGFSSKELVGFSNLCRNSGSDFLASGGVQTVTRPAFFDRGAANIRTYVPPPAGARGRVSDECRRHPGTYYGSHDTRYLGRDS
jgi:hypothetical protein